MEPMPKPPRPQKRRHRFFRRASVPADVRPIIGKTEVIRSLKTSDYREALRRLSLASAEVDAEFEAARRRLTTGPATTLDEHQIKQLALLWFHGAERHAALAEVTPREVMGRAEAITQAEDDLAALADMDDPGVLAAVQAEVEGLMREKEVALDKGSREYRLLCRMIARGMAEETRRGRDRLRGDHGGRSHDPAFEGVGADGPEPGPPVCPRATLGQLVERYLADPTRDAGAKAYGD